MNDETKPSNPKDALGVKKAPLSGLPWRALYGPGLAMLAGALDYGRHNYRVIGVRASVYFDACLRHIGEWWEGSNRDAKSGLHPLDHAIACLLIIRDAEIGGKLNDDRPPASPPGWLEEYNRLAKEIVENAKDPKEPYTQRELDNALLGWKGEMVAGIVGDPSRVVHLSEPLDNFDPTD